MFSEHKVLGEFNSISRYAHMKSQFCSYHCSYTYDRIKSFFKLKI